MRKRGTKHAFLRKFINATFKQEIYCKINYGQDFIVATAAQGFKSTRWSEL